MRSLPMEEWPRADREAWERACRPSVRLSKGGAASHMKAVTQVDLARRYGYLLDYLARRGLLDPAAAAGASVTPEADLAGRADARRADDRAAGLVLDPAEELGGSHSSGELPA